MRCIIELRSLDTAPEGVARIFDNVSKVNNLLFPFHFCLTPPPTDNESQVLVRLANQTLIQYRSLVVVLLADRIVPNPANRTLDSALTVKMYDTVITLTSDHWGAIWKNESEVDHWERFAKNFSIGGNVAEQKKEYKDFRRAGRQYMKYGLERDHGQKEMCANCYGLEEDGNNLFRCARCRQVSYCSRDCQAQHWKKAHRKHCKNN
jgi:hypothetical protein